MVFVGKFSFFFQCNKFYCKIQIKIFPKILYDIINNFLNIPMDLYKLNYIIDPEKRSVQDSRLNNEFR